MAVKCWASALGDCSTVQSREHTVTQGLFPADLVTVVRPGLAAKEIPVKRLVRKILCTAHNQRLSDLADRPAISAIELLRDASLRAAEVRHEPHRKFGLLKQEVDGLGFERWFLKTFINYCYRRVPIYPSNRSDGIPLHLVQAAFGLCSLEEPLGLYMPVSVGLEILPREGFGWNYHVDDEERAIGAIFRFRGMPFTIWLHDSIQPPRTFNVGTRTLDRQMRHIRRMKDPSIAQWLTVRWRPLPAYLRRTKRI